MADITSKFSRNALLTTAAMLHLSAKSVPHNCATGKCLPTSSIGFLKLFFGAKGAGFRS
jgi:hypothetical protein